MMDVRKFIDTENGFINGEIFVNKDIYEQELEQIFARSWVFLAHESMIPSKGDYVQNYIGEDPVLVVRQADGSIRAFLNQCRHRGMRICRAERGNARTFMCSFHGWNYGLDGSLINVPHGDAIYDPKDLANLRTQEVRLHNYKGFVFGTWASDAPSFVDYLGDFAWYFDSYIDRYEGGMEVLGVHKWVLPCNWKFNAEQPASDMYHGEFSHMSAIEVMMPSPGELEKMRGKSAATALIDRMKVPAGFQFSSPFGHGTGWFSTGLSATSQAIAEWRIRTAPEVAARLGETRVLLPGHANIFPNFMMLGNNTFRVTHPRGPGEMEIWAWSMAPVAAPQEVKEAIRVDILRTFSAAGMFEQDDAINWEEEQLVLRGSVARKTKLVYQQMRGTARYDADGFPGKTVPHVYAEEGARGLYQHWADMMSGRSWSELLKIKEDRVANERAAMKERSGSGSADRPTKREPA